MTHNVLILGATGRLGFALLESFRRAGWHVVAQGRGEPPADLPAGVVYDRGPLDDPAYWASRHPRIRVVVHAINPHYTRWGKEAAPALRAGLAITRALGARLMFPGNVYNYTFPVPAVIGRDSEQHPTTRKGQIRVTLEVMLAAAAMHGTRSVVLRAGDFIGAKRPGGWFDLAVTKDLGRGLLRYPGPLDQVHAWQDVDTLANCFVQVAVREHELPNFARFNVAGHAVTGGTLLASTERVAQQLGLLAPGQRARLGGVPWGVFRAGQWLVKSWRELLELRGLWDQPHVLDGSALRSFLGEDLPATEALDAVVARALRRDPRFAAALAPAPRPVHA